uniref:peptidylprolyl isomerase n=1 Tax=Lates calcarifer TaxID=8187 RepID=A0A4W6EUK5_LATCA
KVKFCHNNSIIEENKSPTKSPFEQLRQQMNDILGDGGILKEVVHPGEGPPVPQNASVLIHYSGFLEYSDHPFETTVNFKYPQMMKLGRDVTLVGLELGLLTMQKGEFSRFLFQPQYAYGDMGCPPFIPSSAVVLYEVQILDFLDSGQVDDFVALSPVGRLQVPRKALKYGNKALEIDSGNTKALFRCGQVGRGFCLFSKPLDKNPQRL